MFLVNKLLVGISIESCYQPKVKVDGPFLARQASKCVPRLVSKINGLFSLPFSAVKEDLLCQNRKWHQCLLSSVWLSSVLNCKCTMIQSCCWKKESSFLYERFHLVVWHSFNLGWSVMFQVNVDTLVLGSWRLIIICNVYHLHFWTNPDKKLVSILSFCVPGCKVRAMPLFSISSHFKFAKCRRNI